MFKSNLDKMLADLKSHKRDKKVLINLYIEQRLNKSLKNYYEELLSTQNMIIRRSNRKAIDRIFKSGDKV